MGLSKPKQYLQIGHQSVLQHSVQAMAMDQRVQVIYIAVAADDSYIAHLNFNVACPVHIIPGGSTRAESVLNGVKQARADGYQFVAVHDAARPCLSKVELTAVINAGITHA